MRRAEQRASAAVCAPPSRGRPALRLALLGSTAILLSLVLAAPLRANDECGTGTSVICDAGDADYPFANGITYIPVADLTLVVDGGAAIATAIGVSGIDIISGNAVNITLQDGAS